MQIKKYISIVFATMIIVGLFQSCTPPPKPAEQAPKQLNISVMIDISDRIDPIKNPAMPSYSERDLAIIKELITAFRNDMQTLGTWNSKGRFRVFMEPSPTIANIDMLQKELVVDCSTMDVSQKKQIYDNMESKFITALQEIYSETTTKGGYADGSDIWRFFKEDVKDYCISSDENYRNILVILTDGYIYQKGNNEKNGKRVQNLIGSTINKYRSAANPINAIDNDDFGLITSRNDLQNLEVLVLEIAPDKNHSQKDEEILKYCIGKWLKEMGISHYAVYKSDLPTKTVQRIHSFINQKPQSEDDIDTTIG